jgi:hypothetical protein
VALAAGLIPLVLWRGWLYRRNAAPPIAYLVLAAVILAALAYQGHLGGMMSFGESQAASDHNHSPTSAPAQPGTDVYKHGIEWHDHIAPP